MTTPLERRKRELADEYMAAHPGVPRQQAKRRVHQRAVIQLAGEQMQRVAEQMRLSVSKFEKAWRRMGTRA